MPVIPKRNFGRFCLMAFILLCLVLRTVFLGKNFEFMQKEMRPKPFQTVDELLKSNLKFYTSRINYDSLNETGI